MEFQNCKLYVNFFPFAYSLYFPQVLPLLPEDQIQHVPLKSEIESTSCLRNGINPCPFSWIHIALMAAKPSPTAYIGRLSFTIFIPVALN